MITVRNSKKFGFWDAVPKLCFVGTRMKIGCNVGWGSYFWTGKPYLNYMHGCASLHSSTGAWQTVADGGKQFNSTDHFPSGTLVLDWTDDGSPAECSITGTDGITLDSYNNAPFINRKEYIVNNDDGNGNFSVTVNSGVVTEIRIYEKIYESNINAGEFWCPETVSDLSIYDVLRFMDLMDTVGSSRESYATWPATNWQSWGRGVPVEAMAQLCNLTGADPWSCMPHMFDTANKALMVADWDTYLDAGKVMHAEWSNETWGSNTPFSNAHRWADLLDQPTHVAIYDAANVWDEVAHGGVTGDRVFTFNNDQQDDNPPWSDGRSLTIIRVDDDAFIGAEDRSVWLPKIHEGATDANTFTDSGLTLTVDDYIGDTLVNINDGSFGIVTSNTDQTLVLAAGLSGGVNNDFRAGDEITVGGITPDNDVTRLVYKPSLGAASSKVRIAEHSAEQQVETWDAFETVFGRDRVVKLASVWFNGNNYTEDCMVYERWVEDQDLLCIAPYFAGGDTNSASKTTQEILDLMTDTAGDIRYENNHRSVIKRVNLAAYEGMNHWSTQANQGDMDAMRAFMETPEFRTYVDGYLKNLNGQGVQLLCAYVSCLENLEPGITGLWGAQPWRGATTGVGTQTYQALKAASDAGGASYR